MKSHLVPFVLILLQFTSCSSQKSAFSKFIPKGYVIYEKHNGDLNSDGQEDLILIIKGTNKENHVVNRFDKKVDRNRRGILILFKKNKRYQLISKNYDCFSSENEDGGIYYQPQLRIETEREDIIFNYNHGRYGFWSYRFRYQNSNFNLIKYVYSRNYGPIMQEETTIDFLTKVKLVSENVSEEPEGDNDDVFKDTQTAITIDKLLKLSEIENFDELKLNY